MRQLLGVLRARDTGEHGRAPGLGDLRDLAASTTRQGVVVALRADELGGVPGAVSLAAYRVVQEALTNVVKHGGGSRATVQVTASGGAVLVTVEDYAGPAASETRAGSPAPPGGTARPPGELAGGTGLAGMRERVACFGGEVSAGPAGDHPGWRVRARIPYGGEDGGGPCGWRSPMTSGWCGGGSGSSWAWPGGWRWPGRRRPGMRRSGCAGGGVAWGR